MHRSVNNVKSGCASRRRESVEKLSPLEKVNAERNKEDKKIIRQTIESRKIPPLPFMLSSPVIITTENILLASVNDIRKGVHCSLYWTCLSKKLNAITASDINLKLRKRVVE